MNENDAERQLSEEGLTRFFALSLDILSIVDLDGRIKSVNPALECILGYSQSEVLGRPFIELVHPDDRTASWAEFQKLATGAPIVYFENRYHCKDGTFRWLDWTVAPDGKEGVAYAVGRDVTERKLMEERVQAAQVRLERLAAVSPAVIYSMEAALAPGGPFPTTFVSENIKDLFGYEVQECLVDSSWWVSHVHPDDQQRTLTRMPSLFDFDHLDQEYRFRQRDGTYRWVHDKMRVLRDAKGVPLEIVGSLMDITERKRAEAGRELLAVEKAARAEADTARRKLLAIVDTMPAGVIVSDPGGKIVMSNLAARELLGGEVTGTAFGPRGRYALNRLDGSPFPAEELPLPRAIEKGEVTGGVEVLVCWEDGTEKTILASGSPILDSQGHVIAGVAVFQDVTDRKRVEEQLRSSNETLRIYARVVDNSPDLISVVDRQYVYRLVNPAYTEMHGLPANQIVGREINHLFGEDVFQKVIRPYIDRSFAGYPVQYDAWFTYPVAGHRYMTVRYYPLPGDGQVDYVVVVARDTTERKQAEQFREHYAYSISHDLRAPLTIIQGHAQLLQKALTKAGVKDVERRSAEAIITSAQRMGAMIQDLVDSVRLESGQVRLETQPVNLAVFVSDLCQRATGMIEDGQRVQVRIPVDLPPVDADPDRLERVLMNLLTNALKNSPPETEVVIEAEETDGEVTVRVIDQGVGITTEDLVHIFERFYQATGGRKVGGLGLGLYITRMLVEAHGGHIWAESEPGRGSTFSFTLLPCRFRSV